MADLAILHPGQMGSSVGAAARGTGHRVRWCSAGRSADSRRRAEADGLDEVAALPELVAASEILISVCPPAAAEALCEEVLAAGSARVFVDANAISPQSARRIAERVASAGADFVDGGIVGPPARGQGRTILYLSGPRADDVAAHFEGSPLQTHVLGLEPGQASALKMAFAAWTKGSSALLLAVRALADAEGVSEGLLDAWGRLAPDLPARSEATAAGTGPKAWRFEGEMREIARTFEAAGLPGGFHGAAAELYGRLACFKDGGERPTLEAVMAALNQRA
ncbi:MAG: DUF1932 domain-containing protein [Myxococcales bacterium]|nr:DUF1932 domain-containing protein [Myxococcales bacterium]